MGHYYLVIQKRFYRGDRGVCRVGFGNFSANHNPTRQRGTKRVPGASLTYVSGCDWWATGLLGDYRICGRGMRRLFLARRMCEEGTTTALRAFLSCDNAREGWLSQRRRGAELVLGVIKLCRDSLRESQPDASARDEAGTRGIVLSRRKTCVPLSLHVG